MSRAFVCQRCGETRVAASISGRLPQVCDECDPAAARRRARDRRNAYISAAEADALRRRIAELEALQADAGDFDAAAERAASRIREPGRLAVAQAVRRLAAAEGRQETGQRLLELAAAARSWARVLAANDVERALQTSAEEAAA